MSEIRQRRPLSLRRYLLLGILLPVGVFVLVNAFSLYRQTLAAVNTAYDRTLLASTKLIGELLDVSGYEDAAQLRVTVPYAALEAFEADNQSRMFYRVSTQRGQLVSGFDELPFWRGKLPDRSTYGALVDFYDDTLRGEPVRVAVLLQPVASGNGRAWRGSRSRRRWSCAARSRTRSFSTRSGGRRCWSP